nr:MAG TPA: hypothetical protein [Caudoviricetes sp.]
MLLFTTYNTKEAYHQRRHAESIQGAYTMHPSLS